MQSKRSSAEMDVERYHDHPSLSVGIFFKGFRTPKSANFKLYKSKSSEEFILHGENNQLEYEGVTDKIDSDGAQYVVAVYDPLTKKAELYKTPVLSTKVISKSKKALTGPAIKQRKVNASIQRNSLGEAFGTKKAKKAIIDLERNRIDSDKLVNSAIDIIDSVNNASKDLPTRDQLRESTSQDRIASLANVDATDVEQIYPIHNVIPKSEWQFIRVNAILKETDNKKRLESFPYSKSPYVCKKLQTLTQTGHLTKLQMLYYLSLLLGFYDNRKISNKVKLSEQLNSPPDVLLDGILNKFTISKAGYIGKSKDRAFFVDPQREDKLLSYVLIIIMHLDNFIVEVSPLAQELSLKPSKLVNLFRTLGAIVKGATVAQAEAFGIPKSMASTYKIATLKVPFKLPEMTKRGRGSRR